MVPSRALLLLIAALALPLTVSTGCSDSDSGSKDNASDEDESDKDEAGEKGDASVRSMDGSLRDARVSNSGDGAVDEEEDGDDAGEQTAQDSGTTSDGGPTSDAGPANDGGNGQDAAADGMDAGKADTGDAGKADATVDSGKLDSGEPDAGNVVEDAGEEEEDDAGQTPEDAGKTDADAGKADAGNLEELTDEDCVAAKGILKDDDKICYDGQVKYELVGNKICCVGGPDPSADGTCGGDTAIPCVQGEFCDISKSNGGEGCDEEKALGKCRVKPTECTSPFGFVGCGCNGTFYTNTCNAYKDGISVEVGATSPCIQ
jgi:hypothetical protein